jgi:hypothetical protein
MGTENNYNVYKQRDGTFKVHCAKCGEFLVKRDTASAVVYSAAIFFRHECHGQSVVAPSAVVTS